MEANKLDKSLLSGSTTLLLLQLLSEREMYGYEMIETLRDRSQNVFELKAGTLYPLLHGLEEKGFLEAYEREAGGKTRNTTGSQKKGTDIWTEKGRMGDIRNGSQTCTGRAGL